MNWPLRGSLLVSSLAATLAFATWTAPALAQFSLETVDATNSMGHWTSLALDRFGNPRISYLDITNTHLRYAEKNGGVWTKVIVDPNDLTGAYTSLALDGQGNPRISYYDGANDNLKYAERNAGVWNITTVDAAAWSVGQWTSLALDAAGNPRISYYDVTNGHLKYAERNGGAWSIVIVDGGDLTGAYTSLELDSQGNPRISYYNGLTDDLMFAERNAGVWSHVTVDAANSTGHWTSLALDRLGRPLISYHDQTNDHLKVAFRDAGVWSTYIIDPADGTGSHSSIALDASGLPLISYFDSINGHLKFAENLGSGWITSIADPADGTGPYSSIAVDCAKNVRISYYDGILNDLKFASRGTATCPLVDCDGVVAHWSLDEGAGTTVRDLTGSVDDNGTLVGGPTWVPGISGQAIDFDGTDDRVEVASSFDLTFTTGVSISGWVNIDPAATGTGAVVSSYNGNGSYLRVNMTSSTIDFFGRGNLSSKPVSLTPGSWIHLCGTYDAATTMSRIYLNGVQVAFGSTCFPAPCAPVPGPTIWTIGRFPGGSQGFDGGIDEVYVHNRALTAQEVFGLATAPTLGNGLVGHWCFGEGVGTIAQDGAGSVGDDGALVAGPTWTAGVIGGALDFDGSDDRVEVPNSSDLTLTPGASLSAWVNIDPGTTGTRTIVSNFNSSGYYLRVNATTSTVDFYVRGTIPSGPVSLNPGSWVHLCGTYEAATATTRIYVNGAQVASGQTCFPAPCAPEPGPGDLTIGRMPSGTLPFNGRIDEVYIHNRALTAAEVLRLFGAPTVGVGPSAADRMLTRLQLRPAYPNPFKISVDLSTTIGYDLPRPERVRLLIYNVAGARVRVVENWTAHEAGHHVSRWDGRDDEGASVRSGSTTASWRQPREAPRSQSSSFARAPP